MVYQFSICMSADQIFQWNDATPSSILMKIFWVNIFDKCEHTSYSSTIKTKITKCYYFLFFSYDEIAQCLPHPKWGPDIKGLNMEIIINNDLVWISFSIWYIYYTWSFNVFIMSNKSWICYNDSFLTGCGERLKPNYTRTSRLPQDSTGARFLIKRK